MTAAQHSQRIIKLRLLSETNCPVLINLDAALGFVLAATVVLSQHINPAVSQFSKISSVFLIMLFIVWKNRITPKLSDALLFLVWVVFICLSLVQRLPHYETIDQFVDEQSFLMFVASIILLSITEGTMDFFSAFLKGSVLAVTTLSIYFLFFSSSLIWRFSGWTSGSNQYAGIALMAIFTSISIPFLRRLAVASKVSYFESAVYLFAIPIYLFFTITLSTSRLSIFSVGLFLILTLIANLSKGFSRLAFFVGVLIVAIYISFFLTRESPLYNFISNIMKTVERAFSIIKPNNSGLFGRIMLWETFRSYYSELNMIELLFGSGTKYEELFSTLYFTQAHNSYLIAFMRYGVFGLILILTTILFLLRRLLFQTSRNRHLMFIASLFVAFAETLLIRSIFEVIVVGYNATQMMFFWIVLGSSGSFGRKNKSFDC